VVVIEDTPELAAAVERALGDHDFDVEVCADAETGLDACRRVDADFVVLDLTLPGMDGIEACRRLRTFSDAYVVMLTARGDEIDRVIGLSVGADDYMTKPFSARELVARLHAMQRRPRSTRANAERAFGDLTVDPDARRVRVDGHEIELSRTEYDLLDVLSEQPKVTLSRRQLLERVWGENWFGDDHVIDVHMSNLRRKLGDEPRSARYVQTVRGYGYRMGAG
jgi:DNA-binding response OmpR family regulator